MTAIRFDLNVRVNRRMVTVGGGAALLLLLGVLMLPVLLAAKLDTGRAEQHIRRYLKRQVSGPDVVALRKAGRTLPDPEMAARWQTELTRIDRIEFASMAIRHFLFPPLLDCSRMYVVKTHLRDATASRPRSDRTPVAHSQPNPCKHSPLAWQLYRW